MANSELRSIQILGIPFLALMILGSVGFAQVPHVSSVRELSVVDSKGKTVGITQGGIFIHNVEAFAPTIEMRTIIILDVDGRLIQVAVNRDQFYGGQVIWFESTNCQGAPWLPAGGFNLEGPSLLPEVAVAPPGQTIYVAKPGAASQSITINSILDPGTRCRNYTAQVQAFPTEALVDLLSVFTPPFTLRGSIGRRPRGLSAKRNGETEARGSER